MTGAGRWSTLHLEQTQISAAIFEGVVSVLFRLSAERVAIEFLADYRTVSLYPPTYLQFPPQDFDMAWMRAVCGRLKSDYNYLYKIVYNNFPCPTPTAGQKAKIEQNAQAILDTRALYPDASLADLYDETAMPPELRKAQQNNDRAVMQAYGFSVKDMTESKCVAELMRIYQKLTTQ